jgi:hypothetical protein
MERKMKKMDDSAKEIENKIKVNMLLRTRELK